MMLNTGDPVIRRGDYNGIAADVTGVIGYIGVAGGCQIILDIPIYDAERGETLKSIFTAMRLVERNSDV